MTCYVVKFTDYWGAVNYVKSGETCVQNPAQAKFYETYEAAAEIADTINKVAREEIKPYNLELKYQKPGSVTKSVPRYSVGDAKVCRITLEIEEM